MSARTAAVLVVLSVGVACGNSEDEASASGSAERTSGTVEGERAPEPEPAPEPAPVPIDLLHAVPTTVYVSSAYHDEVEQVGRLFDGDLETAWNSRTDDLVGALIGIEVPDDATVTSIEITAGFTKVDGERDLFTGNHRIRRVRVNREHQLVREHELDVENRALQAIPIDQPGGYYIIELAELLPGTRARWREACVSEIRVMGTSPSASEGAHAPRSNVGMMAVPEGSVALEEGLVGETGDDEPAGSLAGDESVEGGSTGAPGAGTDPAAGAELMTREGIRVTELVLATGIENRRPVGPATSFAKTGGDRIYCYVRVANPDREETSVHIGWEPVDRPSEELGREQAIQAQPEWVTFAFTTTQRRAGRYRCVVRTGDGEVLGRAAFDLTE